jgi:hypothetical protein
LRYITARCRNVLGELEKLSDKYSELDSKPNKFDNKVRRTWKRLKLEPVDIRDLRRLISSEIILLKTFNRGFSRDNTDKLAEAIKRMREQADGNSVVDNGRKVLPEYSSRYMYRPLHPDMMIRVLELEPGTLYAEIKGKLRHVSLYYPPKYSALSYVWGDPEITYKISIDGQAFFVSSNLESFLRHIRSADDKTVVWVDAICIDQQDVEERNIQVRHMKRIYELSQRVLAWLGVGDYESKVAFKKMREVWAYSQQKRGSFADSREVAKNIQRTDKVFFVSPSGDVDGAVWEAMNLFFQNPWWSRAWILQESTTSVPTFLVAGRDRLPYAAVATTILFVSFILRYHDSQLSRMGLKFDRPMAHSSFRADRISNRNMGFLRLLVQMQPYDASDPRDKVYTAVGLADDLYPGDIQIDYKLPVAEVYRNVAQYLLTKDGNLDWLGLVSTSDWHPPCPNWVPIWSQNSTSWPLPKRMTVSEGSERPVYCACGTTKMEDNTKSRPAVINGNRLITRALVIDSIKWVSEVVTDRMRDVGVEQSWAPENPETLYRPTGETMERAFLRTLVADTVSSGSTIISRASNIEWPSIADRSDLEARTALAPTIPGTPPISNMKVVTGGRRLAFSKKNGYMGLVPHRASVGNLICILQGLQVPCLVSSRIYSLEHKCYLYSFVGECYMHGIMDGEALRPTRKGLFKSNPQMITMVLR